MFSNRARKRSLLSRAASSCRYAAALSRVRRYSSATMVIAMPTAMKSARATTSAELLVESCPTGGRTQTTTAKPVTNVASRPGPKAGEQAPPA